MAIAFNLPTNEDTEARYELLNRLLLELCDVVQTIVTARSPVTSTPRARPVSDSALPRIPDLLLHAQDLDLRPRRRICSVQTPPASPSCSTLNRTFSDAFDHPDLDDPGHSIDYFGDDDEVFYTTSIPNANRPSVQPRQRRRRRKSSFREKKKSTSGREEAPNWKVEGSGTRLEKKVEETPSTPPTVFEKEKDEQTSVLSALLSTSLGGPLWTTVVIFLGWKLLTKR